MLAGKEDKRRSSALLPEQKNRLSTEWEMYAITEEDPQAIQQKTGSLFQEQNRPSTPVFDSKLEGGDVNDKNDQDEEGNFIFEQIKAQVKELDSEDDQA